MHASLRSVRISPKKAGLVAGLIRGMPVPEAQEALRRTHKKGARILEKLLNSAAANARHNTQQDPQMLVVRSVVVNKAATLHRGVPMARGRVRPIRKFLSHIEVTLGVAGDDAQPKQSRKPKKPTSDKSAENTSQTAKKSLKRTSTETSIKKIAGARSKKTASDSSVSSDSSIPSVSS